MITEGSVIFTSFTDDEGSVKVDTIAMVDSIDGENLYCSCAITRIDHSQYIKTNKLYPTYTGEHIDTVRLCTPDEFDEFMDHYPSRSLYINV